jgi:hypothetical protein
LPITYGHLTFTLQDDRDVLVHVDWPGERDFVIPRKDWDEIVAAMSGRHRAGTASGAGPTTAVADLPAPLGPPVGQPLGPGAAVAPVEKTIEETREEQGFVENPTTPKEIAQNEKAQARIDAARDAEAKRAAEAQRRAASAPRR